jgi:hypothetical protein
MKRAQKFLHSLIKRLWEENKIIRLFILKARQTGVTTYLQALMYSIVSQTDNINAVDIADDLDGSNYIFEMAKLYHEKMPAHLKKPVKKSNEKKLEFEGTHSQLLVDTATNKDAGRKYTFRAAHLSEYAFYKTPDDLMLGLSQSVPSMPRTMIFKETTANGFNFAKDDWDKIEAGESDYIGVFIPWYWDDDYTMSVQDGFIVGDPELGIVSKDEHLLIGRMRADGVDKENERLTWRRWCIRNNCGNGSDQDRVLKFKQEYPSIPIEAFKASGDCYFDQNVLTKYLELKNKPVCRADVVYADFKSELRINPEGEFWFWEKPLLGVQYIGGGDASSGSGADYSTMVIRRKDNNKIVCTYRAKIDPDELAYKAMMIGTLFNFATMAIENDKFGFAANQKLKTIYKKIYVQRSVDKLTQKVSEKYGWDTNATTRPMMLSQMQQEIREKSLIIQDERIIKECLVFIVGENGKVEAQEGCNDDFVIACAISGVVRQLEPIKVEKVRAPAHKVGNNLGFGFKK